MTRADGVPPREAGGRLNPALIPSIVFLALALLGFWLDPPNAPLGAVVFGALALAYTWMAWVEAEEVDADLARLDGIPAPGSILALVDGDQREHVQVFSVESGAAVRTGEERAEGEELAAEIQAKLQVWVMGFDDELRREMNPKPRLVLPDPPVLLRPS